MSEIMEETVLLILNDLKADMEKLKEENQNLQQRINEYKNKFNCYTKEQSCLLFKIQKVKQKLNNMNIKKSGHNKFNHYDYYELEDINKPISDCLIEEGLSSLFTFKDGIGYLQIVDSKTGAWIQWSTPLRKSERYMKKFSANDKTGDVGDIMKDEQALQTYARRALYLQALEIAEPNSIEQEGSSSNNKKNNSKSTTNEISVPDEVDDVTKSIFQQIRKDFGTKVQFNKTTITNKLNSMKKAKKIDETMYTNCIKTLEKM